MKFVPHRQLSPCSGTLPILIEIGVIENKGVPFCRVCEVVEEREPGSRSTFACLPVSNDADGAPANIHNLRATLLSDQECATFDANSAGSTLRNIANHIATRFSYKKGDIQLQGEQQRNAAVLYHRDIVSFVAALY